MILDSSKTIIKKKKHQQQYSRIGVMDFDVDDMALMLRDGILKDVIMHEIG